MRQLVARTLAVLSLAATASPRHLTFVLIDFKGGSAFDACARLPHTCGVVTDLDEHLASRALRCLEAELRHRELRLRQVGADDLGHLRRVAPLVGADVGERRVRAAVARRARRGAPDALGAAATREVNPFRASSWWSTSSPRWPQSSPTSWIPWWVWPSGAAVWVSTWC